MSNADAKLSKIMGIHHGANSETPFQTSALNRTLEPLIPFNAGGSHADSGHRLMMTPGRPLRLYHSVLGL